MRILRRHVRGRYYYSHHCPKAPHANVAHLRGALMHDPKTRNIVCSPDAPPRGMFRRTSKTAAPPTAKRRSAYLSSEGACDSTVLDFDPQGRVVFCDSGTISTAIRVLGCLHCDSGTSAFALSLPYLHCGSGTGRHNYLMTTSRISSPRRK